MRRRCLVTAGLAALALGSASAAPAAQPAISGTLAKPGYTVIALSAAGVASSARTTRGRFSVRPPASAVTLHLRGRDGRYAGPVVIGRDGAHAILGVRAGARLGTIAVGRGYARVKRRVPRRWVDRTRWARARGGIPIGATRFGRVRSKPPRTAPPGDRDADGIAGPLDIDDDGDLVLDDVERRTRARAAQTALPSLGNFTLLYQLGNALFPPAGPRTQPVNVNAGVGDAAIEDALRAEGKLSIAEGSRTYVSGELDCRGLSYCSAGGTGLHEPPGGNSVMPAPGVAPFPACCDADGNGRGAFDIVDGALNLFLHPRASSEQIRAGDLLLARATCKTPCAAGGAKQIELAGTLGTVFATVPAIASYVTEDGATHVLHYPLKPHGSTFPREEARGDEITVFDGADPGTDASVTLTFWRPQRRAIPGEVAAGTGAWIDIGHLIQFAHTLGASSTTWCPADAYSNVSGGLAPAALELPGSPELPRNVASVFTDGDDDRAAAPGHVFRYTLNVTRCQTPRGRQFGPGSRAAVVFTAMLPLIPGQPINFVEAGYSFFHSPSGAAR